MWSCVRESCGAHTNVLLHCYSVTGCGQVGMAIAYAILNQEIAGSIALVDINEDKLDGKKRLSCYCRSVLFVFSSYCRIRPRLYFILQAKQRISSREVPFISVFASKHRRITTFREDRISSLSLPVRPNVSESLVSPWWNAMLRL